MMNKEIKKRVLITGKKGKVGMILVRDIKYRIRKKAINWKLLDEHDQREIRFPEGINNLPEADIVFHLAAVSTPGRAKENPSECLRSNVASINTLISHYQDTAAHLVIASTISSTSSGSLYAWTKIAAEAITLTSWANNNSIRKQSRLKVSVVRLGNVIQKSNSIVGIRQYKSQADKGFLRDVMEYYQPSYTVFPSFEFALDYPGCIVTPMLFNIPIPFLAGLLAGYDYCNRKIREKIKKWNPKFEHRNPNALIPDWWLNFTKAIERPLVIDSLPSEAYNNSKGTGSTEVENPGEQGINFLVTDLFAPEISDEERGYLNESIRQQEEPKFGKFISYLSYENLIPG